MEQLLFSPLSPRPSRANSFLAGWGLQIIVVAALVILNALLPSSLPVSRKYAVVDLVPPLSSPPPITIKPRVISPKVVELPVTPAPAASIVLPAPARRRPQTEIAAPELKVKSSMPQLPAPAMPKVIAVNTFSSGSSAVPTTNLPAAAVQTGGFGDDNGVRSRAGASVPANIAAAGAFDLPKGDGHGNGAHGAVAGVVASAGFGNGDAIAQQRGGGSVQQAGFDSVYSSSPQKRVAVANSATTPVEIVFKPKPQYTEEGRKQGIDGEVRLEVLFSANGAVHVIRVLQGLGYGLDERAVQA